MASVMSSTMNVTPQSVAGVAIPNSKVAREVTELVRDTESPLLFHHSSRVYYWGALTGKRRGLRFDRELLYARAMFHDMGLTPQYASADKRFEVDGANVARDFLRSHGIAERDIETIVWSNPIAFFGQTGRIDAAELADARYDQSELWEGNSVLRGQAPEKR